MPRLSQKLEQKQKLAPRQVLQARLLQLNTLNLEQAILKELELNPILEQVEPEDFEEKSMAEEILEEMDAPIEDVYTDESSYYIEQEKSDLPLPDRTTFIEKIIEQLKDLGLSDLEREIAEDILWNINERGYLDTDLILIADNFELEEQDIEPILFAIQRMEPKGLGARDLKECLLLQLENKTQTESIKLAQSVLQNQYTAFANKNYEKLLKEFDIDENQIRQVYKEVEQLNPKPGSSFTNTQEVNAYITADFLLDDDNDELNVILNNSRSKSLRSIISSC